MDEQPEEASEGKNKHGLAKCSGRQGMSTSREGSLRDGDKAVKDIVLDTTSPMVAPAKNFTKVIEIESKRSVSDRK